MLIYIRSHSLLLALLCLGLVGSLAVLAFVVALKAVGPAGVQPANVPVSPPPSSGGVVGAIVLVLLTALGLTTSLGVGCGGVGRGSSLGFAAS